MPETWKNGLSYINNCIYYAYQTHQIYKVLSYSVEIHWVNQYLVNVVLFEIDTGKHLKCPYNSKVTCTLDLKIFS